MHQVEPVSWKVASASVQGAKHKQNGLECQDRHGVHVTDTGALIILVADGAGSATHAGIGAEIAVETASHHLVASFSGESELKLEVALEQVFFAFDRCHLRLSEYAEHLELPLSAFHTTLTCVVALDDGFVIGKIGDGVVAGALRDGEMALFAPPENGKYVNMTYFVTQLPTHPVRLSIWDGLPESIAVSTDGLLDVAFDDPYGKCIPWGGFFSPITEWVSSAPESVDKNATLASFLNSDRIQGRSDDDLTLVLAVREHVTEAVQPEDDAPVEHLQEMVSAEKVDQDDVVLADHRSNGNVADT